MSKKINIAIDLDKKILYNKDRNILTNNRGETNTTIIFGVIIVILIIAIIGVNINNGEQKEIISSETKASTVTSNKTDNKQVLSNKGFLGEKGATVTPDGDLIYINEVEVSDGNMHSYNYYSEKAQKQVYFFVVKASDGTYRVAANACEVCYGDKKGFRQVGDRIQCDNCGNSYTKDQIALEKGGCNPSPISKNAEVENGKLIISLNDADNIANLF